MLTAIYKSPKKPETYLYVEKRDDFSRVPEVLLDSFGSPSFVMLINLDKREELALVDIVKLREQLLDQGFYLQLPPPTEDLLSAHKKQQYQESKND